MAPALRESRPPHSRGEGVETAHELVWIAGSLRQCYNLLRANPCQNLHLGGSNFNRILQE